MDRIRIEETGPLGTYIASLRWGLGEVVFALAVVGLAGMLIRGDARMRVVAVFPLVYFAFLGKRSSRKSKGKKAESRHQ